MNTKDEIGKYEEIELPKEEAAGMMAAIFDYEIGVDELGFWILM